MNKHILVFFCFNNVEHIKISFDSMYQSNIDYFIVENKSNYSEAIKDYFLEQKKTRENIVGYIQFEKNIVANAMNIFFKDYIDLLKQYEYITITDGDYYVYDMKSTVEELLMAFNHPNCAASSAERYPYSNWRHPNRVIGVEHYVDFMKKRENIAPNNIVGIGTFSLMTIKKQNLEIIENVFFNDGNIRNKVSQKFGSWYLTVKNQCYHLTDECCYDEFTGDAYMTWKRNIGHKIWSVNEDSDYVIII